MVGRNVFEIISDFRQLGHGLVREVALVHSSHKIPHLPPAPSSKPQATSSAGSSFSASAAAAAAAASSSVGKTKATAASIGQNNSGGKLQNKTKPTSVSTPAKKSVNSNVKNMSSKPK
jgi:hypothetical protein